MAENYFHLSLSDQRDILATASNNSKEFSPLVLEKDIWICWALRQLFSMQDQAPFVFKGGTSLSKVYDVIHRFSEDVDITIDYHFFEPTRDPFEKTLSNTQIKKAGKELEEKAQAYIRDVIHPYLQKCLKSLLRDTKQGQVVVTDAGTLEVEYPTAIESLSKSYISDRVKLEFGGRNTIHPNKQYEVVPYLKQLVPALELPVARIDVLDAERTFWEKATLIHAWLEAKTTLSSKDRISRHWYDLACLTESDIGTSALENRNLLSEVVKLKKILFLQKNAHYDACLSGHLQLVPGSEMNGHLEKDFAQMREARFFFRDPPPWENIIEALSELEVQINGSNER